VLLRVVTFNVRSFRAGRESVRALLADLGPDVAMLQECRSRRQARRLGSALEMEVASTRRRRVRNAVLFRPPWRALEVDARVLSRQGRTLPRGFVAATLWQPGFRITAVSAHLGLSAQERERHARELTDLLAHAGAVVLGTDLNEGPEGAASRWIAGRYFDAFDQTGEGRGETFPAGAPTARIDYLFVSDGAGIVRAWIPEGETGSDHLPVAAELELPGP
jgi:endonuclease/exonuclease/phosphatase family metal-dependent hydrolase